MRCSAGATRSPSGCASVVCQHRGRVPAHVCTCATGRQAGSSPGLDSLDEEDWDRAEAILRGEPWPPGAPSSTASAPSGPSQRIPSRQQVLAQQAEQEDIYPPWEQSGVKVEYLPPQAPGQEASGFLGGFRAKLTAAWAIFFPTASTTAATSRKAGLNRLKVVLVADRVGMTAGSFQDMKRSIIAALGSYVEIADEAEVEISMSEHPEMGAIYSVSVPVRRVKTASRVQSAPGAPESLLDADGVTLSWDETNWDSDPSDRFPFGV